MVRDIAQWLREAGLDKYIELFVDNDIDFAVLPHITEQDLIDLGVAVGARRKIAAAFQSVGSYPQLDATCGAMGVENSESRTEAVERRQLTIMFCDLVGSTTLSSRLDPEDLRDVMRLYQDTVSGIVARNNGYVANFLGDGIVACFGWPRADEDQALQAVRAGLASTAAVSQLCTLDGEALSARVGIASGMVVVGDLATSSVVQSNAISGETPNLAARLQGEAQPGEVLIGGIIHRLLGVQFELEPRGERFLRGLAAPMSVWRVDHEIAGQSRFETSHAGPLTSLVGRTHELGVLSDYWEMAKVGEGQILLIEGEAGIGKSRLYETFRDQLRHEDHLSLHYQCAPHHTNSPLYPSIQQLGWAAGFIAEDSIDQKLDKLEAFIKRTGDITADVVALFANLLSLPVEERYGELGQSAPEIKQRTLQALCSHLIHLASRQTVLLIVEDVHWMDPSSAEMFSLVVDQIQVSRIFIIMTHRPEWSSPFGSWAHVARLEINRLDRRQGAEMVRSLSDRAISKDVVTEIVRRTDGVPLFIEEVTKSVTEGGLDPADLDIPATLHASLLARIDRLGAEVKAVAQAGAVIGRQFSLDLLGKISDLGAGELRQALDRLVGAELLFGLPSGEKFMFKHALVQDAAYLSLLIAHRRRLHCRVAEACTTHFEQFGEPPAEVVAHHYSRGEKPLEAAQWWVRAGQFSSRASATKEATSHFRNALDGLATAGDTERRVRLELTAWVGLGPLLMAAEGVSSQAVAEAYENAVDLAEQLGDDAQLFRSRFGIWHLNNVKGDCRTAKSITDTLLEHCSRTGDEAETLQAHHASWSTAWMRADFEHGREQMKRGQALYDADRHADHKFVFGGHDPGVCCRMFSSWHFMSTGNIDGTISETDAAFQLSRQLNHPYSTSVAYLGSAISMRFLELWGPLKQFSADGIDLCETHGIKSWLPILNLARAGLSIHQRDRGDIEAGIATIEEAKNMWTGAGAGLFLPWFDYEIANGQLALGKFDDAAEALELARRQCDANDERWLEPEIIRLEARMRQQSGLGVDEANEAYERASAAAQKYGVVLTGFQTSVDHAQFLASIGANDQALHALKAGSCVTDTARRLPTHHTRETLLADLSRL